MDLNACKLTSEALAKEIVGLLTLFTQRTQCQKMFIVYLISTKTNTAKFLKVVRDFYKAFLVHEKGKTFDSFKLQLALELVHNCRVFFEENERTIYRIRVI